MATEVKMNGVYEGKDELEANAGDETLRTLVPKMDMVSRSNGHSKSPTFIMMVRNQLSSTLDIRGRSVPLRT